MRDDQDNRTSAPRLRFPEFRDAGSYRKTTIGSISNQVIAGGTPDTSEKTYWGGKMPWMNSGELNLKRIYEVQGRITEDGLRNSSTRVIPPRCVLIGLAGQGKTRGTVAMNMVSVCTNQSIAAIFPNESVFISDFIYYYLDSRYDELRRLSAGGEGRGGLNLQLIKNLAVALPPLHEQQKIANCFTSLDEVIAAQGQKLDALKAHKRGLMQQLFPREGETRPRLRFPEFRDKPEWEPKQAGELFVNRSADGTDGLSIYSVTIHDGMVKRSTFERDFYDIEDPAGNKKACMGDIAYNMMRMWQGALGVAPEDCMVSPAYVVLAPLEGVCSDFFAYLFKLPQSLRLLTSHSRGLTKDRLRLYYKDFTSVPLRCPSVVEQRMIADFLASCDFLIAAESRKLDALKTHKKGLMQQLFPAGEES